jgi:hypothetical protein
MGRYRGAPAHLSWDQRARAAIGNITSWPSSPKAVVMTRNESYLNMDDLREHKKEALRRAA